MCNENTKLAQSQIIGTDSFGEAGAKKSVR